MSGVGGRGGRLNTLFSRALGGHIACAHKADSWCAALHATTAVFVICSQKWEHNLFKVPGNRTQCCCVLTPPAPLLSMRPPAMQGAGAAG